MLALGLDIRDLGSERLTYRRLRVLLENAPRDSAFVRSVGGAAAVWSLTDHLLALAIDTLTLANWQRGGSKGKRPEPLERPGAKPEKDKRTLGTAMSVEELNRRLGRV